MEDTPQFLWPYLLPLPPCAFPEARPPLAPSLQVPKAEETYPEQEPPGDTPRGHPLPDGD